MGYAAHPQYFPMLSFFAFKLEFWCKVLKPNENAIKSTVGKLLYTGQIGEKRRGDLGALTNDNEDEPITLDNILSTKNREGREGEH